MTTGGVVQLGQEQQDSRFECVAQGDFASVHRARRRPTQCCLFPGFEFVLNSQLLPEVLEAIVFGAIISCFPTRFESDTHRFSGLPASQAGLSLSRSRSLSAQESMFVSPCIRPSVHQCVCSLGSFLSRIRFHSLFCFETNWFQ